MDFKKDEAYYAEAKEVMEKDFLDKRTKDYRTYKEYVQWYEAEGHNKAKGLGDVVESVAKATGADKLAKAILGDDCGCEERKKKMNEKIKLRVFECMVEDDYNYLKEFFAKHRNRLDNEQQTEIYRIYNYIFGKSAKPSKCSSCVRSIVNQLKQVMNVQA